MRCGFGHTRDFTHSSLAAQGASIFMTLPSQRMPSQMPSPCSALTPCTRQSGGVAGARSPSLKKIHAADAQPGGSWRRGAAAAGAGAAAAAAIRNRRTLTCRQGGGVPPFPPAAAPSGGPACSRALALRSKISNCLERQSHRHGRTAENWEQ